MKSLARAPYENASTGRILQNCEMREAMKDSAASFSGRSCSAPLALTYNVSEMIVRVRGEVLPGAHMPPEFLGQTFVEQPTGGTEDAPRPDFFSEPRYYLSSGPVVVRKHINKWHDDGRTDLDALVTVSRSNDWCGTLHSVSK